MCELSSNGSSTWGSEQHMSSRTGDVDSQTVYSRQYLTQPKYDISWDFRKSWYCASCSAALVWQCGHPEYLMSHVVLLRSFRTSESCITVIFKLHRKRYSAHSNQTKQTTDHTEYPPPSPEHILTSEEAKWWWERAVHPLLEVSSTAAARTYSCPKKSVAIRVS